MRNAGNCYLTKGSVLAGNGVAEVAVFAKPGIGILATGNELVAVDAPVDTFQIRRSNDATLKAALQEHGFNEVVCDWVADDQDALTAKLAQMLAECEVVLVTGGVSRGSFDYVPGVLKTLGVEDIFHGVAQRPGKPLWFGKSKQALVFGLPGNPNSALTCLIRYVVPMLKAASGGRWAAGTQTRLAAAIQGHEKLTLFVPVWLETDGAMPRMTRNSGDFTGLVGSDGFMALRAGCHYATGDIVDFFAWGRR